MPIGPQTNQQHQPPGAAPVKGIVVRRPITQVSPAISRIRDVTTVGPASTMPRYGHPNLRGLGEDTQTCAQIPGDDGVRGGTWADYKSRFGCPTRIDNFWFFDKAPWAEWLGLINGQAAYAFVTDDNFELAKTTWRSKHSWDISVPPYVFDNSIPISGTGTPAATAAAPDMSVAAKTQQQAQQLTSLLTATPATPATSAAHPAAQAAAAIATAKAADTASTNNSTKYALYALGAIALVLVLHRQ
jgi:hypothetical protein